MVEFLLKDGFLSGAGLKVRAAHGRGGITNAKQEGDGATPVGTLRLVRLLYRADRLSLPPCAVPVAPLSLKDGWCDAPTDSAYNQPVTLPYPASHEELWRDDGVYDIIGVLDWNLNPIIPGQGSAIFFHVATPDYAPTAGCIALNLPDMLMVLAAGLNAITIPEQGYEA